MRVPQADAVDRDIDILTLRRGWWREHWRAVVVLAVLAAVVLAAWWPRPKPTVVMPAFETKGKRLEGEK